MVSDLSMASVLHPQGANGTFESTVVQIFDIWFRCRVTLGHSRVLKHLKSCQNQPKHDPGTRILLPGQVQMQKSTFSYGDLRGQKCGLRPFYGFGIASPGS